MENESGTFPDGKFDLSALLGTEGFLNRTDYNGHSLLHWAVQNGDKELCRNIVSNRGNVDHRNNFGVSPLMLASLNGDIEIVKLLLETGTDCNLTNVYGATALTLACASGNVEIVKLLTSWQEKELKEEDTNCSWPQHPVILSAAYGAANTVEYFYQQDHDCINKTASVSGMNALMLAEAGDFKALEEKLISWGATRNPQVKQIPLCPVATEPCIFTPLQNISFLFPSPNRQCSPFCQHGGISPQYPLLYSHGSNSYSSTVYHSLGGGSLASTSSATSPSIFLFPPPPQYNSMPFSSPCYPPNSPHTPISPFPHSDQPLEHPLTPNVCFSPTSKNKTSSPPRMKKTIHTWFKKLKRKRSKSLERVTKVKKRKSSNMDHNNILDYILSTANLSEYKSCFIDQEVTFRTFLTLNEDELVDVGIKKPKVRKKLLKLIQHYKRIFFSQT